MSRWEGINVWKVIGWDRTTHVECNDALYKSKSNWVLCSHGLYSHFSSPRKLMIQWRWKMTVLYGVVYLEPHMAIAILGCSANPTVMYQKLNRSVPETRPKIAKICWSRQNQVHNGRNLLTTEISLVWGFHSAQERDRVTHRYKEREAERDRCDFMGFREIEFDWNRGSRLMKWLANRFARMQIMKVSRNKVWAAHEYVRTLSELNLASSIPISYHNPNPINHNGGQKNYLHRIWTHNLASTCWLD